MLVLIIICYAFHFIYRNRNISKFIFFQPKVVRDCCCCTVFSENIGEFPEKMEIGKFRIPEHPKKQKALYFDSRNTVILGALSRRLSF